MEFQGIFTPGLSSRNPKMNSQDSLKNNKIISLSKELKQQKKDPNLMRIYDFFSFMFFSFLTY